MAREDQAAQCRRGLDATLGAVHRFTADAFSVRGKLLHRMNAVLCAAYDSNFGARSLDSIGDLYEAIDREQHHMLTCLEDMPLLFFARSFAAVLEEAVRQLNEKKTTATVPVVNLHDTVSDSSWNVQEERENLMEERKPSATSLFAAPAAADDPLLAGLTSNEIWRREMQRNHPWLAMDFSDAAIEGRIMVHGVPRLVLGEDLTELLRPFGPLLDFYYRHGGFAHAKLQSNSAADEAVRWLNGSVLRGVPVKVTRTRFMARPVPGSRQEQAQRMQQLQQPQQLQHRSNYRSTKEDSAPDPRADAAAARAADAAEGGAAAAPEAAAAAKIGYGREESELELEVEDDDEGSCWDSCFNVD